VPASEGGRYKGKKKKEGGVKLPLQMKAGPPEGGRYEDFQEKG
jgi:hypothetical protein